MNQLSGSTLLIVDDEEDLLRSIAFDFKRKGFKVLTATGGHEALSLIESGVVDLVITDVNMPKGDGLELLERIKAKQLPLPVLMFVSGSFDLTPEQAYEKGADAVITKPFNRKELMDAVLSQLPTPSGIK